MAYPKQNGQSGHPIPDPVMRTTLPAIITKYTKVKVVRISREKTFDWIILQR
jgi:hypothetical protein